MIQVTYKKGDILFVWDKANGCPVIALNYVRHAAGKFWGHVAEESGNIVCFTAMAFPDDVPVLDVLSLLEPGKEQWKP